MTTISFGSFLKGRYGSSTDYRYGFQGQEKDDEIKGEGNSINYTFRMHDPRVGRFFAVDPLERKYPHNSPYAFSENVVINAIELEGLEKYYFNNNYRKSKKSKLNDGLIIFEIPLASRIIQLSDDTKLYYFRWMSEERFTSNPENENMIGDLLMSEQFYLKINSPMTIQGADGNDGFNTIESGNLFGKIDNMINKWKSSNWIGNDYKNSPNNVLNFKRASGTKGDLDYKFQLKLDDNTLYDINGTLYNKNEAGNFYWGYTAAKLGIPLLAIKIGCEIFTTNQKNKTGDKHRNFDEPWEVDAYIDGYVWGLCEKILETYNSTLKEGNNIDVYNYDKEVKK